MKNIMGKFLLFVSMFVCLSCQYSSEEEHTALTDFIEKPTYLLYPTKNMWIFLKLNTVNGRIDLVQYSIEKEESRFEGVLNGRSLLKSGQKEMSGRFALIPTENIWNFILLDQVDGGTWQVQWSFEPEKTFVVPISR